MDGIGADEDVFGIVVLAKPKAKLERIYAPVVAVMAVVMTWRRGVRRFMWKL